MAKLNPFDGLPGIILVQGFSPCYERNGIFTIEEILKKYRGSPFSSQRYRVFDRSLSCVSCGLTGSYFARERHSRGKDKNGNQIYNKWHYNLYAIRLPWEEILMTKDHIIPKCKGGLDNMENYQTMCQPCNARKGAGL